MYSSKKFILPLTHLGNFENFWAKCQKNQKRIHWSRPIRLHAIRYIMAAQHTHMPRGEHAQQCHNRPSAIQSVIAFGEKVCPCSQALHYPAYIVGFDKVSFKKLGKWFGLDHSCFFWMDVWKPQTKRGVLQQERDLSVSSSERSPSKENATNPGFQEAYQGQHTHAHSQAG